MAAGQMLDVSAMHLSGQPVTLAAGQESEGNIYFRNVNLFNGTKESPLDQKQFFSYMESD